MADTISDVLGEDAEGQSSFSEALEAASYKPVSFTTKRFALQDLVDAAIGVVPRDGTILDHFQFYVSPGLLAIYATDMELSVIAETEAVDTDSQAVVTIPARRLARILKEAPEDKLRLEASGSEAVLTVGSVKWRLNLKDPSAFPDLPELTDDVQFHETPRLGLVLAIKAVRHAMCQDATRAALRMIDISDKKVTACDGARIQQVRIDNFPLDIKIPAGAVDHVLRLLQSSEAEVASLAEIERPEGGGQMVFRVGTTTLVVSKPTAKFPDMEKLLLAPAMQNNQELTVDRLALADAVRRVRINADLTTSAIGIMLTKDALTVVSRDTDRNAAEETLEAGWSGPDRMLVVNHVHLLDLLNGYDGRQCTFRLGKDTKHRKSAVLLQDSEAGVTGVLLQLIGKFIGYQEAK